MTMPAEFNKDVINFLRDILGTMKENFGKMLVSSCYMAEFNCYFTIVTTNEKAEHLQHLVDIYHSIKNETPLWKGDYII